MTLWGTEIGGVDFEEILGTRRDAVGLVLDVLDATLHLVNPEGEEVFDSDTLAFTERATGLLRAFVDTGEVPPFDEQEFFEAAFLESDSLSPYAGSALRLCLGQTMQFATDQMDWTGVRDGLDACYEVVLQRQALGSVVTVEKERENASCRRAIELQKELIAAARRP
jgi:hypothetical protein